MPLFRVVLLTVLLSIACGFSAKASTSVDNVLFGPGLICDTRDQAERFVSLLGDGVETALGTVNREAGTPDACLVTNLGFRRGDTVSEVLRNGAIFNVIEVTVLVVTTQLGLQPIEPKKYFSIVATGDRIA